MTASPNITNPTGADTLATLIGRYRGEFDAFDCEAPDSDAVAAWTWQRTLRQIACAPAVTKTDALAALDLIEEELEISKSLNEPFPELLDALRGYIKSTAMRPQPKRMKPGLGAEPGFCCWFGGAWGVPTAILKRRCQQAVPQK